jgi:hypothetical protein
MAQIKDTNVIKTPEVVLNPQFFLPPDVIDMRSGYQDIIQEDNVTYDDAIIDADNQSQSDYGVDNGESGTNESAESIPSPQWMNIIDQQVRISTDGKAIVDVTVEFEDISGSSEYDIRVTKS